MVKVKRVEVQADHRLSLTFSDGTRGVVDFRPMLARRAFRKLKDEALFAGAFLEHGAVTWPGDIAIASEALYAAAHELPHPDTLEAAQANEREMSLRDLRRLADVTQAEAAARLGMDQGQLSRFERGEDRLVSSLRRYVEALGGELEVVATVDGKKITLRGV
jgi:DNA-binding transcriptional regulator YiaG